MSSPFCTRMLLQATRRTAQCAARRATHQRPGPSRAGQLAATNHHRTPPSRSLSMSTSFRAGMMPDTSNPQPPQPVEEERSVLQPTELDNDEYHLRADEYMEAVHEKAEAIQEAREDAEVEFSAGVLSITIPPAGTYVLNKQPPNKQIWLSSPVSGPKRYDWVLHSEGMHQKEGGGVGDWIYLRDGSSLTDLLRTELGVSVDLHGHDESMKQSVDPTE